MSLALCCLSQLEGSTPLTCRPRLCATHSTWKNCGLGPSLSGLRASSSCAIPLPSLCAAASPQVPAEKRCARECECLQALSACSRTETETGGCAKFAAARSMTPVCRREWTPVYWNPPVLILQAGCGCG